MSCAQPCDEGRGYHLYDDELVALALKPGRVCEGGACSSETCARVIFPAFATPSEARAFRAELEEVMTPPLHHFELAKCAFRSMRATLMFVRLIERMRRAVAHEYGLPLKVVSPVQAFAACFVSAPEPAQDVAQDDAAQEGVVGAAQGVAVPAGVEGGLHADESSFAEYHYSGVVYLTSQGVDFEGGMFYFDDPVTSHGHSDGAGDGVQRVRSPLPPSTGAAVLFSSGWESMHQVSPLISGTRLAVPVFFTTRPEAECDADPSPGDAALAEELWSSILQPKGGGDVVRFMRNWHWLLTVC